MEDNNVSFGATKLSILRIGKTNTHESLHRCGTKCKQHNVVYKCWVTTINKVWYHTLTFLIDLTNHLIIICGASGVGKQSRCSFIVIIRFVLHSTGPTFINPTLTFITSCLMGFSYFRSQILFQFWIVSYDAIAANLLFPYSIKLNSCLPMVGGSLRVLRLLLPLKLIAII